MSRLGRWLTRNVGRIVETVPDPGGEILSLDRPADAVARERTGGDWHRWLSRVAESPEEGGVLRVTVEEVAALVGAGRVEVWLRDGDATVRAAVWPEDPGPGGTAIGPEALARLESGRPWRSTLLEGEEDVVVAPLPGRPGVASGWILARRNGGGPRFRDDEIANLSEAASMLGAFLRCARRWSESREAALRRRDEEIVRQLRHGLRPPPPPAGSGVDLAGAVQSADAPGGCHYGTVSLPGGALAVTVADVAGTGLEAALFLAAARGAVQAQERSASAPGDLLSRVNEMLFFDFDSAGLSATACHVRIAADGRSALFANAGHVTPVLLGSRGEVDFLERGGPALGILPEAVYPQGSLALEEGCALLLFTEGLLRARGVGSTPYGLGRLIDRARRDRHRSALEIREGLVGDVAAHAGRGGRVEEFALVVAKIRCRAEGPAR